jgi:hypothetical protein
MSQFRAAIGRLIWLRWLKRVNKCKDGAAASAAWAPSLVKVALAVYARVIAQLTLMLQGQV